MRTQATSILYFVVMVAVIVTVDVLFFKNAFRARLVANIVIVLLFMAFYFVKFWTRP